MQSISFRVQVARVAVFAPAELRERNECVVMCVVMAFDAEIRKLLEAQLRPLGLEAKGISSLGELPAVVTCTPVGGILLELATSVRSTPQEKDATHALLQLFPFARFRVTGSEVRILGDEKSLEEFALRCQQFEARIARRDSRENKYLAVYLSRDSRFEDAEKTITINVGKSGCFVYSNREWKPGETVWLRLSGDETALSGTVRYCHPWGNNKTIPGIGLQLNTTLPWAEI